MAEGAEETESSNADTPAMLGAVMPCEALTASIGGMKREFDAIGIHSSPTHITNATATVPYASATGITATKSRTKSPSPSSSSSSQSSSTAATTTSSSGNVQQHPINLKSENNENELNNRLRAESPIRPKSRDPDNEICSDYYKNMPSKNDRLTPQGHDLKSSPISHSSSQNQLNGTMQDMINLQKLQNLASMQQHSSVPVVAALAGLQGLPGISSAAALNSPLNLSVGSTSTLSSASGGNTGNSSSSNNNNITNSIAIPSVSGALGGSAGGGLSGCSPSGSPQMPQLILASGQLVQGVQGAQLLIPTSQGIAIQTILTIPVSQQINTSEQFMQNYVALNNTASAFANPTIPPPPLSHPLPVTTPANYLKPNLFSSGVQQLLAALHPQLFPLHPHHHQTDQMHQAHHQGQQQVPIPPSSMPKSFPGGLHKPDETSPRPSEASQPHQGHCRESSPPPTTQISSHQQSQHMRNSPPNGLCITAPHSKQSPLRSSNFVGLHLGQEKSSSDPTSMSSSSSSANAFNQPPASGSQLFRSHSPNSHMTSSSHSLSSQVNSPSSVCVLNSINRLTSGNGELTITKSHAPHNHSIAAATSCSPSPGSMTNHQTQSVKLSPSSMHLSPTGTEASTSDLLVDSPNEPTINQTNCNVVDGIDLDEIKEFAKAFKLRRLSLGLTQTQVGQALSVTEGPAYSQSAICSALAAQMYAAQLSSQQQNMFEKLDITPKSAQKIKPVLERWMKEAEESHWNRYKTGQNHLTDFIGVEPSKKRKRRTSFTPQALELLNAHFERNTHPSGTEITGLAHQLGYEREVIRIWFCNKRQALKNTVRMMSKGMV